MWSTSSESLLAAATVNDLDARATIAGVGWRDNDDVFVAAGRGVQPSFLFRSVDKGVTWQDWTPNSSSPGSFTVKGNNYASGGGTGGSNSHPRPTGRLVGFGSANPSLVYVAGMDELVRINDASASNRGTGAKVVDWPGLGEAVGVVVTPGGESGGPAGDTVWGVLRDPGGSTDPWVSTGTGNGLVKVTGAEAGPGSPSGLLRPGCVPATARPAEAVAVSESGVTAVYVAWGKLGVFRYKSGGWDVVARTSATPSTGDCVGGANLGSTADVAGWTALDAVRLGSSTMLVVGGISGGCGASPCPVVQRVTIPNTGAPSAVELVSTSADVESGMLGDTSRNWWHIVRFSSDPPSEASTDAKLGGASWVTSMVDIVAAPSADNLTILASGRGGVWQGIYASGNRTWRPAVRGLSNTFAKGSAVDPVTPNHAVGLDGDWQIHLSSDTFDVAVPHNHRPAGTPGHKYNPSAATFDADGGLFIGDTDGDVWYNPDPYATTSSTNCWVNLSHPTSSNGKTIIGLTAGKSAATGTLSRVVAAFRDASGTKGTWSRTVNRTLGCAQSVDPAEWVIPGSGTEGDYDPVGGANEAMAGTSPPRVGYSWKPGSNRVYMFDQGTGLSRSTDYGQTFTTIAALDRFPAQKAPGKQAGWVVADPDHQDLLYVDFLDGVYKIANANTCKPCSPTQLVPPSSLLTSSRNFAGLAVDTANRVLVANQPRPGAGGTTDVALWRIPAGGGAWTDISDGAYRGLVVANNGLFADPKGLSNVVLAPNDGFGLVRITP